VRIRPALIALIACSTIGIASATAATIAQGSSSVSDAGVVQPLGATSGITAQEQKPQEQRTQQQTPPPHTLVIDTLGGSTPLIPVGVDAQGFVEVPQDVNTIGWYRFGPAPGAAQGRAVLVGHRDARDQGKGFFAGLPKLNPGDEITVEHAQGQQTYVVTARTSFKRTALPKELFNRTGDHELVLISCAGTWSPSTGYSDNVVVLATPVSN
jgi:LPXTG-site transpeptidase (sortase) family protein